MIRPDIGQKNLKTTWNLISITVRKLKKKPISPNFNPDNFELYIRGGTHYGHNCINGQFL